VNKNIDIEHYEKCPTCNDEFIWFVNCGTKEDYYETKMNQIKEEFFDSLCSSPQIFSL
jgi:hypothetical protein